MGVHLLPRPLLRLLSRLQLLRFAALQCLVYARSMAVGLQLDLLSCAPDDGLLELHLVQRQPCAFHTGADQPKLHRGGYGGSHLPPDLNVDQPLGRRLRACGDRQWHAGPLRLHHRLVLPTECNLPPVPGAPWPIRSLRLPVLGANRYGVVLVAVRATHLSIPSPVQR